MINSLLIGIILLETAGICKRNHSLLQPFGVAVALTIGVVRGLPVRCTMSGNKVSEAGRWPYTVGTYRSDSKWTELKYYRLQCNFSGSSVGYESNLFRVYHDHWKRPFEKADCEYAGCIPVIWNAPATVVDRRRIIDVYWANVVRFVTTAAQLKICKIDAANVNVTLKTSQLNDPTICQPSGSIRIIGNILCLCVKVYVVLECKFMYWLCNPVTLNPNHSVTKDWA